MFYVFEANCFHIDQKILRNNHEGEASKVSRETMRKNRGYQTGAMTLTDEQKRMFGRKKGKKNKDKGKKWSISDLCLLLRV